MKSFLSDEARIRLLDANVTDYAIFMIDTDERIASWNSGAERILGYADADIIGQRVSIIFTHEDRESGAEQKEFLTARETGRADDERWHLRKDGSRLWALVILTALYDEQGQLQGYTKILRDFTARMPMLLEKLLLLLQSIVGVSRIERQLDEVYVSTRMGSSIALIVNELVTNAVHYGNGSIRITLSAVEGNAVLAVLDNGPGFPEGFHANDFSYTGLELVENLTRLDLRGEVRYRNRAEGGGCVEFLFRTER